MSDLWLIAYESIQEEYDAGRLDIDDVRAELKRLGFDPHEIEEHVNVLICDDKGD